MSALRNGLCHAGQMSDLAQHMERLRFAFEHHELHDLSDERVMHTYYGALLWVYAVALIEGGY